jgi:BirA family biotin operon repressor/biotin-[acetyl-CoA-carboxylase] ligase
MFLYLDQTDSTNRVARERALAGEPSGTVVWAGRQSSGRGQYGRSFSSPTGGLYFSLVLHPELPLQQLPLITLATGLACRELLAATFNLEAQIKWPNDLYLKGRKIAGILCEQVPVSRNGSKSAAVVIGVGMNVNSTVTDFPLELQSVVTTVHDHVGGTTELKALLTVLVEQISAQVGVLQSDVSVLLAKWQKHDYLCNQRLTYTSGSDTRYGIGLGITPQGFYRFLDSMGMEHTIIGGQLRPWNGTTDPVFSTSSAAA